MSRYAETVIAASLCDDESMAFIVKEGLNTEVISDERIRRAVDWSLRYFIQSGMKAPSLHLLESEWGTELSDAGVDLSVEPDDSVEWALEQVNSAWLYSMVAKWQKDFAMGMADADSAARKEVVGEGASELLRLSMDLDSLRVRSDFRHALGDRIAEYERRASVDGIDGMGFGLGELDTYTHGIRPGELAVVAAGPKTGKSFWACLVALSEWQRGRATALFTLENSPGMTVDRIACLYARVDPRLWDTGDCTDEQVERVKQARSDIEASDVPLWIVQPDLGRRSFASMVAEARILESESVIVDQLTFVEMPDPRKSKTERIGEALHRLKGLISTGRQPIPLMLMHQVNREGVKLADKTGWLEMHHMAESAEVERTADWVFGMYASDDDRHALRLRWQTLASRRAPLKSWELTWALNVPAVSVRHEIERAQ